MATNIGTGPQDIPLNQFLGEMAFMDTPANKVFWAANFNVTGTDLTGAVPIVFDNVLYNIGGAYDGTTGYMTAPRSGLYFLSANIISGDVNQWLRYYWQVSVNGGANWSDVMATQSNYANSQSGDFEAANSSWVHYLNEGDILRLYLDASSGVSVYRAEARFARYTGCLLFG